MAKARWGKTGHITFILFAFLTNIIATSSAWPERYNVDTDIVFTMMKNYIEEGSEKKAILVSGDGDYKKVVHYLIKKKQFLKILFPNQKFASSLYKKLGNEYQVFLDRSDIKNKIDLK